MELEDVSKNKVLIRLNNIANQQNKLSRNFEFLDLYDDLIDIKNDVIKVNDQSVTEKFLLIKQSLLSKICRFWDDEDDHVIDLTEVCVELGNFYYGINAKKSIKNYNLALEGYSMLVSIDKSDKLLLEKYAVEISKICGKLSKLSTKYNKSKIIELYPHIADFL